MFYYQKTNIVLHGCIALNYIETTHTEATTDMFSSCFFVSFDYGSVLLVYAPHKGIQAYTVLYGLNLFRAIVPD